MFSKICAFEIRSILYIVGNCNIELCSSTQRATSKEPLRESLIQGRFEDLVAGAMPSAGRAAAAASDVSAAVLAAAAQSCVGCFLPPSFLVLADEAASCACWSGASDLTLSQHNQPTYQRPPGPRTQSRRNNQPGSQRPNQAKTR